MDKQYQLKKFYECTKYIPSEKEISLLIDYIIDILPLLRALIKKYNITNPDVLANTTTNFSEILLDEISKTGYIDSKIYELQAINSILKDHKIISEKYDSVKDKPNIPYCYNGNLSRSQSLALINAIEGVRVLDDFIKKYGITKKSHVSQFNIPVENGQAIKDVIKAAIQICQKNSMNDKIVFMLEQEKNGIEKFIKEQHIISLRSLYDFFSIFGYLSTNLEQYNSTSKKYNFADLKYELTTGSYTADSIGLNELFSEKFLQTQSIENLSFLTAFWNNRFSKKMSAFHSAITAIDSLNLWQDILNENEQLNLETNELIASIRKSRYLHSLVTDCFTDSQDKRIKKELKERN